MAAWTLQNALNSKYAWLWFVLAIVLVFNFIDASLTLLAVHVGIAEEANPIMAAILSLGSVPFVVTKIGLVSLGVAMLWRMRRRPLAVFGSFAALCAYAFVMGYHVETIRLLVL